MKCEVEFLPVGDGEKAGDCIVVRYGEEHAYHFMVVDGGTLADAHILPIAAAMSEAAGTGT